MFDLVTTRETAQPATTAAAQRRIFADTLADLLAAQAGVDISTRVPVNRATLPRFVRYQDKDSLTLVVGEQEAGSVDTALAVGLGERNQRTLRLVLPRGWHEPTQHRWAWLRDDLPLEVWSHDGEKSAAPEQRPTRLTTQTLVASEEDPLLHLGNRTPWVEDLMLWAGEQSDLDASHRRDVRAWQCRGQRVLRISRTGTGLSVVAGIDWGAAAPHQPAVSLALDAPMSADDETAVRNAVLEGMQQRLNGVAHKADEHWLQAVLRRHPRHLGLEQPVLRELPAWRPSGSAGAKQKTARGRGFVDLVGLDANGSLLLVETKLGADHMLVLQGLDYRIWAEANRARLTKRLDCRTDVPLEISYCVGGKKGATPTWSSYTAAQLDALAPDLRWHIQEVTKWTGDGLDARRGTLQVPPMATSASAT
jgi:hypothetical protein